MDLGVPYYKTAPLPAWAEPTTRLHGQTLIASKKLCKQDIERLKLHPLVNVDYSELARWNGHKLYVPRW